MQRALLVVGSTIALVALYTVASLHAFTGNSDGATVVLEGKSLIDGNLLLHGWDLSLDSFWTVDGPAYAFAVAVVGVREILVHVVPATIAAVVVLMAALMGRDGRRGGAAMAGVVTVGALLVFPTHTMAMWFLQGPLHMGTLLLALAAFWALRTGEFGWRWMVAVVLIVAGMNGDLLIVAYAVVPILLAGIVAMARCRSWRAGLPNATAAIVGGGIGEGLSRAFVLAGGYTIARPNPSATVAQMVANVRDLFSYGADLIGAQRGPYGNGGVPSALQDVHVAAAALLTVCLLVAVVRLADGVLSGKQRSRRDNIRSRPARDARPAGPADASCGDQRTVTRSASGEHLRWYQSEPDQWRLDDMLTIACFGPPCTYVVLAFQNNPTFIRYLTATVVLAAIVAARVVARQWSAHRRHQVARSSAVVGVAVAACFAAGFGFTLDAPMPSDPEVQLAAWLSAHHLRDGVGAYWSASATTVASDGAIKIRPVVAGPTGRLERYLRQSSAAWYGAQPFTFLVYQPSAPWGGVDSASAVATWGQPSASYTVGAYDVLVWPDTFNVSATSPPGTP